MSCAKCKIVLAIAAILLMCLASFLRSGYAQAAGSGSSSSVSPEYFPPGIFDFPRDAGNYRATWYSCILAALKEPSLFDLRSNEANEVYRFLWLPSFRHPISVRLIIKLDGSGSVVAKSVDQDGGLLAIKKKRREQDTSRPSGTLTLDTVKEISEAQVTSVLKELQDSRFWSMSTGELGTTAEESQASGTKPTTVPLPPVDGARWIVEGVRNGEYHVVDRWSPQDKAFRQLCMSFLMLGKVETKNIY